MVINKAKFLLCFSGLILLSSCGGSDGGSDSNKSSGGGNSGGGNLVGENSEGYILDTDNYVGIASSLYSSSIAAASLTTVLQGLNLVLLQSGSDGTRQNDCDISGTSERELSKVPGLTSLSAGDVSSLSYTDCEGAGVVLNGTSRLEVLTKSGDYPFGDYSILLRGTRDVTHSEEAFESFNGRYEYNLYSTFAEELDGALRLVGINVAHLHAGVIPVVGEDDFAEAIIVDTEFPRVDASYMEDPVSRFDTFAFERITDRTGEFDQEIMLWHFDVVNKLEPSGDHHSETTEAVVLEERTRLDAEGFEEFVWVATAGRFEIEMANGDELTVVISEPSGSMGTDENTVTVSLDLTGDGSTEAQSSMTWEEFEEAFFIVGF